MNKNYLTFFIGILLTLFFFSCKNTVFSDQEIAENLVSDLILENLNDPSTYESLEFGKLDSANLIEIDEGFLKFREEAKKQGRSRSEQIQQAYLSMAFGEYLGLNSKKEEKKGYKILHKFRAVNDYGLLVVSLYEFYLDSELKTILYSEEVE